MSVRERETENVTERDYNKDKNFGIESLREMSCKRRKKTMEPD